MIKLQNVTIDYNNNKGIFDLDFTVQKGEVIGFVGPNGAGKTTTIRTILGFIRPQSGIVLVNGYNPFTTNQLAHKSIGYLPGEIAFMDDMSAHSFIQFIADEKGIKDLSYAYELIQYFELDLHTKIKKMSKGMKQKLGLVVAFMGHPDLIILDEPTSGLDPLMQKKFIDLIQKNKSEGKTIFMSSHIFEEVEKTCDRLIMIKDGHIIEDTPINKLQYKSNKTYIITLKNESDALQLHQITQGDLDHCTITLQSNDINNLIHTLSSFSIKELKIEEETLEEMFLNYYGGTNND